MFFAIPLTREEANNKNIQCVGLQSSNVVFSIKYKPKKGYKKNKKNRVYVHILVMWIIEIDICCM